MLSRQVNEYIERSSWIRRMFEAGIELKSRFGEDQVCDFSLGNPDVPPPAEVRQALLDIAENVEKPFSLGYMPNAGYADVREQLAAQVSKEQGFAVSGADITMTVGAAGGLNAFFRAVLDPCDEVVVPSPFFVEYGFYVQNHGGGLTPVKCKPLTFDLDIEAIARAVNEKTRVVMVNSPNNPSGAVYSRERLQELAEVLKQKSRKYGRPIYLLADEPYRFLAFDGVEVPSILPLYPYSVVVSSFSKNLSLAGERLGYIVLNPDMPDKQTLADGLVLTNRILGFVNAPAVAQQILRRVAGVTVDAGIYDARRKAMAKVLEDAGYEFTLPKGGFYFFPKAPDGDDVKFCGTLQEQRILAVPGAGFGYPGYFRLAFCVGEEVIMRSAEGFARALAKA